MTSEAIQKGFVLYMRSAPEKSGQKRGRAIFTSSVTDIALDLVKRKQFKN